MVEVTGTVVLVREVVVRGVVVVEVVLTGTDVDELDVDELVVDVGGGRGGNPNVAAGEVGGGTDVDDATLFGWPEPLHAAVASATATTIPLNPRTGMNEWRLNIIFTLLASTLPAVHRRLPFIASAALSVAFVVRMSFVLGHTRYFTLFDDAMISMRYARNLAHGHGLIWNAGGAHVEGYTNFAWTLWMTLIHLLPISDAKTSLVVMATGALVLIANLAVVRALSDRLAPDSKVAAPCALWLTALAYPLLSWTLLGMEVGLVALAISSAVLLLLRWLEWTRTRDLAGLAVVLALAELAREDALIPAALIVVAAAILAPASRRRVAIVVLIGALSLTLAVHTAFRVLYYHAALPNTYDLKLGHIPLGARLARGSEHLITAFASQLWVPVAAAILAFAPGHLDRSRRAPLFLLAAIVAAQWAYSVYVGGDSYDSATALNRFIAVGLPLLFVLAGVGVANVLTNRRWLLGAGAVAVLAWVLRVGSVRPGQATLLAHIASEALAWRVGSPLLVGVALLAAVVVTRRGRPSRDRPGHDTLAGAALTVAAVVAMSAMPLTRWVRNNDPSHRFNQIETTLALDVRAATSPNAVIATAASGQISYFSDRTDVDLLGYSDRVVARGRPTTALFIPGHDKWNFTYSLGRLRPDVIVTTFPASTPYWVAVIRSFGYQELGPELYMREGSPLVNADLLRQLVFGPAPP